MIFEFLFDEDKVDKSIRGMKDKFLRAFGDVEKGAKRAGSVIDDLGKKAFTANKNAAASSNTGFSQSFAQDQSSPNSIKFNNRRKGDMFSSFAASQDSQFRKLINDALKARVLRPSDLKDSLNRKNLVDAYKKGDLKDSLTREIAGALKNTNFGGNGNKGGPPGSGNSSGGFWSNFFGKPDEHRKELSVAEKLENNYFTRLRGQLVQAALAYVSYRSAKRLALNVFDAGINKEKQYFDMQIAYGNKANVSKAMDYADQLTKNGNIPFRKNDLLQGFTQMQEMGLDPRKNGNFETIGNIAGKRGKSFSAAASDINSAVYGNSDVLRQYGLTNQQVFSLDKMVDQRPESRKNVIMQILSGDKRYKNGMQEFANSWEGMTNQMKNFWQRFTETIVGDPKNKNSLFSKIKEGFKSVLDWLTKNQQRIERFGTVIGAVLKWVFRQVMDFGKYVAKSIDSSFSLLDGSEEKFRDKTSKLILWLELTKEKIVRFFDKWGWLIKDIAEVWAGSKIVKLFTSGIGSIVTAFSSLSPVFGESGPLMLGLKAFGNYIMVAYGAIKGVQELINRGFGLKDKNKATTSDVAGLMAGSAGGMFGANSLANVVSSIYQQKIDNAGGLTAYGAKNKVEEAKGSLYAMAAQNKKIDPALLTNMGLSQNKADSVIANLAGLGSYKAMGSMKDALAGAGGAGTTVYKGAYEQSLSDEQKSLWKNKHKINPAALRQMGMSEENIKALWSRLTVTDKNIKEQTSDLNSTMDAATVFYVENLNVKANDVKSITDSVMRQASKGGFQKPIIKH